VSDVGARLRAASPVRVSHSGGWQASYQVKGTPGCGPVRCSSRNAEWGGPNGSGAIRRPAAQATRCSRRLSGRRGARTERASVWVATLAPRWTRVATMACPSRTGWGKSTAGFSEPLAVGVLADRHAQAYQELHPLPGKARSLSTSVAEGSELSARLLVRWVEGRGLETPTQPSCSRVQPTAEIIERHPASHPPMKIRHGMQV